MKKDKGQSETKQLAQLTKRSIKITVDKKVYKISPLELSQLSELDDWAALQPFERLEKRLQVITVTEEERKAMMASAHADASDPLSRGMELGSIKGMIEALRLSLSINHPEMTDGEFKDISNHYPVDRLMKMLDSLSDTGDTVKK